MYHAVLSGNLSNYVSNLSNELTAKKKILCLKACDRLDELT